MQKLVQARTNVVMALVQKKCVVAPSPEQAQEVDDVGYFV